MGPTNPVLDLSNIGLEVDDLAAVERWSATLTGLDVSGNRLSAPPESIGGPTALTELGPPPAGVLQSRAEPVVMSRNRSSATHHADTLRTPPEHRP
jgi:hypothetical protein